MPPRMKWIERKFQFTLPPSRYAGIVARLRDAPTRLQARTDGLRHDDLVRRDDGRWSIQEQAGHLLDLEPLWYRRAAQLVAGEAELEAADLTNRATDAAHHNAADLAVLLGRFREARSRFVELLSAVDDAMIVRSARHPRLGQPMRLIDLASFIADHDDHHLATIDDLLPRRR